MKYFTISFLSVNETKNFSKFRVVPLYYDQIRYVFAVYFELQKALVIKNKKLWHNNKLVCLKFVNSKIFCLHRLAVKHSSENTLKWMGTQNKYKRNLQKKTDIVSSEFSKHRMTIHKGYDAKGPSLKVRNVLRRVEFSWNWVKHFGLGFRAWPALSPSPWKPGWRHTTDILHHIRTLSNSINSNLLVDIITIAVCNRFLFFLDFWNIDDW